MYLLVMYSAGITLKLMGIIMRLSGVGVRVHIHILRGRERLDGCGYEIMILSNAKGNCKEHTNSLDGFGGRFLNNGVLEIFVMG